MHTPSKASMRLHRIGDVTRHTRQVAMSPARDFMLFMASPPSRLECGIRGRAIPELF